jgi:hypothetical protein
VFLFTGDLIFLTTLNEELHNLYSSPSGIRMIKSRRIRWTGHVARMGRRGMHIGYWLESEMRKDHWEDQRRRWGDNIKMDLRETEWDVMDWIDLAWHRDKWRALVNTVINLRVP